MGDFNLHHPDWNDPIRYTAYTAADKLIEIASNYSLELATPRGIVTWRSRGTQSTIDLSFISDTLSNELLRCNARVDLAHASDHLPIETTLRLTTQRVVTERRRNWKELDVERLLGMLERVDFR